MFALTMGLVVAPLKLALLAPLTIALHALAQATQVVPVQINQLLTLALGVVFVTEALKWLAGQLDKKLNGKGAVAVSGVIAVLLTALAYGAGWVPISIPVFGGNVFEYVGGWLATAGAATALANVLYVLVYDRAFGKKEPTPTG
jgi:hypothetical protein